MGKLAAMSALSWDRCVQFAIPTFGIAVAAFAGFCVSFRAQQPGAPMSWQSLIFLSITAAFLSGGLLLTGLAIARHPGASRWRWKVFMVVGIVAVTVLVGARFYRDLTELGQGVLFGVGAMLLLEGARRGYYLQRKRHYVTGVSAVEPTASSPPRVPAAPESVEQLRKVFGAQVQCTGTALHYLKEHALLTAKPEEYAKLVRSLLDKYAIPAFVEAYGKLYPRIDEPVFEDDLADLIDAFNEVTAQYITVANWILWACRLFRQDEFLSDDLYGSWFRTHKSFLEEIMNVKDRHDLRRIVQTLPSLMNLLPDPKPKYSATN